MKLLAILILSIMTSLIALQASAQTKGKSNAPEVKKINPEIEQGRVAVEKSDCLSCHRPTIKLIGPSFRSIAQKYKPTLENQHILVQKILEGGSGTWGEVPMSPHSDLEEPIIRKMITYILSLK